jgi:Skp family chaperone for outer membrane proteins
MEFSTVLIGQLKELKTSNELRNIINKYIEQTKNETGLTMVLIRSNYHYIIDNINKSTLINELTKLIN